ncbi:DMT family transporter [Halobacillus karajensis]|uniref:Carboxylate/amino acid/amine transporter n=1 Tax=Halobacillus karajensis TaxID=195088 RepID=A0A024P7J8_9BACI|nr:DMT family transporter [Halobacillus karajensis]CDQ21208.1 carboxylate/amino acid/amine transporter [Halobacillus karajensis]CDQ24728.1 carboxylate/amino acid/amine transporter [Halobacillus karajensis]CDQ28912.1 carboxylate/amino acid/amine transporter [Halobacillus karajensis]
MAVIKERLTKLQLAGVFLSFCGALGVVINGNIWQLVKMNWNIGDIIMVGAIICWAVYSMIVKEVVHLFPPLGVLLVMTGISLIVLIPFVTLEWISLGVPPLWNFSNIIGFLYLGIFPSLIALLFYNHAVAHLGASKASIFLNLLPVFTMAGAYIWLGDEISMVQIIGAGTVILGVVFTTRPQKVKEKIGV